MKFKAFTMAVAAGLATVFMAGQTLAASVFTPTDSVWGGQSDGTDFAIASEGFASNMFPGGEAPSFAIDGFGQKYLNFGKENTGLVVTASGSFVVDSLQIWAANDAIPRDPASYALYGTNVMLSGSPGDSFSMSDFSLISEGALALPDTRNFGGNNPLLDETSQTVAFTNDMVFESYMLLFPTLKDSANANSMQIAEVQLFGERVDIAAVPIPAAGLLLIGGLFSLGYLRRRA